ncbi:MAG: hypothetical protein IKB38_10130 [Clostridia bacterium]|nr:hypothetical protein [Clostridia bacterium]
MLKDLTHNKIIADTVTDAFIENVDSVLVPLVEGLFGDSAIALQMYEDYIADGFLKSGKWCYPFTVIKSDGAQTLWVSWSVDKRKFKNGIPYAYIGNGAIDFAIMENVPEELSDKLAGRNISAPDGCMKVKLHTAAEDPLFLSGKYSQTFIDEMGKQLTEAISRAMSVKGLESSSLSLQMIFAPETYMEHTSENVTYRRLRIADKASAPRDFWIKWTRTNSAVAYSVSDHPVPETIKFELGEDVPQKVREKEYRFLLRTDDDRYHASMSRKNVTEWRELVKRALRRGEIEKVELESEYNNEDLTNALLSALPSNEAPVKEEPVLETADDAMLKEALQRILETTSTEENVEEVAEEAVEEAIEEVTEEVAEEAVEEVTEEATEEAVEEVTEEAAEEAVEEVTEEAAEEAVEEVTEEVAEEAIEEATENAEEYQSVSAAVCEDALHAEIEAKIRLEYEANEKIKVEEEAKRLLEEQEKLRLAKERLIAEEKRFEEERAKEEALLKEREEKLRATIEAQLRAEAREKERLAEAAMIAIEEKRRIEAERAEELRKKEEEERRLESERLAAEERERKDAEIKSEAERILREAQEQLALANEKKREADERMAEVQKLEAQKSLEDAVAAEKAEKPEYTFTAKSVLFFFRYHIDPRITEPMEAIIRTTLERLGKDKVPINIKAVIVDDSTVRLDFVKIPVEEEDLLIKIVQALGNGNLGIAKARVVPLN